MSSKKDLKEWLKARVLAPPVYDTKGPCTGGCEFHGELAFRSIVKFTASFGFGMADGSADTAEDAENIAAKNALDTLKLYEINKDRLPLKFEDTHLPPLTPEQQEIEKENERKLKQIVAELEILKKIARIRGEIEREDESIEKRKHDEDPWPTLLEMETKQRREEDVLLYSAVMDLWHGIASLRKEISETRKEISQKENFIRHVCDDGRRFQEREFGLLWKETDRLWDYAAGRPRWHNRYF